MSSLIKSSFNSIWKIGYDLNMPFDKTRRIVLSNRIYLLFICLTVPYIYLFTWMGAPILGILTTFIPINCFICLLLNKQSEYYLSRCLFLLTISIPTYFFASFLGPDSGIQYTCFALIIATFALLDDEHKRSKFIFILIHVFIYFLLELSNYYSFYHILLSDFKSSIIRYTVIGNVFIILILTLTFYSDLTQHYKFTLEKLIRIYPITDRESEIIAYILRGLTNKEIANTLFIEENTVKTHLKNIFKKLKITSRIQLVALVN